MVRCCSNKLCNSRILRSDCSKSAYGDTNGAEEAGWVLTGVGRLSRLDCVSSVSSNQISLFSIRNMHRLQSSLAWPDRTLLLPISNSLTEMPCSVKEAYRCLGYHHKVACSIDSTLISCPMLLVLLPCHTVLPSPSPVDGLRYAGACASTKYVLTICASPPPAACLLCCPIGDSVGSAFVVNLLIRPPFESPPFRIPPLSRF